MSDEAIIEVMPLLISAGLVVLVIGMFFTYMIVRLMVRTRIARETPAKKKTGRKGEPEPYQHPSMDGLVGRAGDLNRRLAVLEEIMAAEQKPGGER